MLPLAALPAPTHDWQFYIATALALFAAAWLLRGILPIPILSKRLTQKKNQRRVNLTIGGKPPGKQLK